VLSKVFNTAKQYRCTARLPSKAWACRWSTSLVCDIWPLWHQTYGYLSCLCRYEINTV